MLAGKTVLVGVTGGIAAYKAAELVSLLVKEGAAVRVVMTEAATRFVAPLTFASLSGHPVATDLFDCTGSISHIDLAGVCDLAVVAPATADFLGKLAAGLAGDLLSTLLLACERPVLLCPAMNVAMYRNPAVQENLRRLVGLGYQVLEPDAGRLACGAQGQGRLPDPARIVARLTSLGGPAGDLAGYTVLVTAGATREPIDPVRFISNRSSGKMGFALAAVALERGARVILVSGAAEVAPPPGVRLVTVDTAAAMRHQVLSFLPESDCVIKAAAVADYRPARAGEQKIKKDGDLTLQLVPNPDILQELGAQKGNRVLVGFAAETENLLANAQAKLRKKNLDLLVANDVSRADSGFGQDQNQVWLLAPGGPARELPLLDKRLVAGHILDEVARLLAARRMSP